MPSNNSFSPVIRCPQPQSLSDIDSSVSNSPKPKKRSGNTTVKHIINLPNREDDFLLVVVKRFINKIIRRDRVHMKNFSLDDKEGTTNHPRNAEFLIEKYTVLGRVDDEKKTFFEEAMHSTNLSLIDEGPIVFLADVYKKTKLMMPDIRLIMDIQGVFYDAEKGESNTEAIRFLFNKESDIIAFHYILDDE